MIQIIDMLYRPHTVNLFNKKSDYHLVAKTWKTKLVNGWFDKYTNTSKSINTLLKIKLVKKMVSNIDRINVKKFYPKCK